MIQDFTFFFFANITASYVNRNKQNQKRNQEVRMEYKPSVNPMFIFTLRHFSNISAHKQENQ